MSPLNIIYEDDSVMVINKPPNLVVTPDEIHHGNTLVDILEKTYKISIDRGGVVHRLDKDTSGILLVGKTEDSYLNLKSQFKSQSIKKKYLALVHGIVKDGGEINVSLSRNPLNKIKMDVFKKGRQSITDYKPLKLLQIEESRLAYIFHDLKKSEFKKLKLMNYQMYTLINCFPRTGRTHQIRVHLKYINHPVVSDTKYGGRKNSKLDLYWCPRQFLHAKEIEFTHPKTKQTMKFEASLPGDLAQALSNLEPFITVTL